MGRLGDLRKKLKGASDSAKKTLKDRNIRIQKQKEQDLKDLQNQKRKLTQRKEDRDAKRKLTREIKELNSEVTILGRARKAIEKEIKAATTKPKPRKKRKKKANPKKKTKKKPKKKRKKKRKPKTVTIDGVTYRRT